MDFVEIYNVCARKAIIEAAKRIINSDKVCRSYSDLNFGVTFFWNTVYNYKLDTCNLNISWYGIIPLHVTYLEIAATVVQDFSPDGTGYQVLQTNVSVKNNTTCMHYMHQSALLISTQCIAH